MKLYGNGEHLYGYNRTYFGIVDQQQSAATDIVPLAAYYSGNPSYLNVSYCKNFTLGGTTIITATYKNLDVKDRTKLSFQNGSYRNQGYTVGGVYGYDTANQCISDFNSTVGIRGRGLVMFGPSSYYTGAESGRPQIKAMVANTQNNAISAANIQVGGHCTNNGHFVFDTPLTSNQYGVYGFVSNPDRGVLYGGCVIQASAFATTGFEFRCFAASGTRQTFNNANFQMVVIQ